MTHIPQSSTLAFSGSCGGDRYYISYLVNFHIFVLPNPSLKPLDGFRVVHEVHYKLFLELKRSCEDSIVDHYVARYRTTYYPPEWNNITIPKNSSYIVLDTDTSTEIIIQLIAVDSHPKRHRYSREMFHQTFDHKRDYVYVGFLYFTRIWSTQMEINYTIPRFLVGRELSFKISVRKMGDKTNLSRNVTFVSTKRKFPITVKDLDKFGDGLLVSAEPGLTHDIFASRTSIWPKACNQVTRRCKGGGLESPPTNKH
ncbi:hypothetical protein RB195_011212 [Necator americanus]|uniref:Uncharacterized protein n=1 Tax=Necator americanus TaxID=51031 RepID=A0ABR1D296_NECAM